MNNNVDVKLIRKLLRRGNFGGHIKNRNLDFKYTIYGVRRSPYGEYSFNIKIWDYKVKTYVSYDKGYQWCDYKLTTIPKDLSRVRHHNWMIRNDVTDYWSTFLCNSFGISRWRFTIGLIKRI